MRTNKTLTQEAKQKYNEYMDKIPALRRQRIERFTTLFLTFGALIVFLLFAINPTVSTIINLKKQLNDSLFVKAQITEKLKNLTILEGSYSAIGSEIPFVFQAIPKTPDAPNFFAQIQALAAKNQVVVTTLQADTVPLTFTPNDIRILPLPFSLTITGTYTQAIAFLTSLSTEGRIITLSDVAITKSAEGTGTVQITMKGKAYFKP